MVRDGKTGLVVPPEDVDALAAAIERLCRDPALRMRLGEQGRLWVETERNWAQNAQLYIELYRHIDSAARVKEAEAG
jgi:glycosyltransferase involved in cell wall biosynthesis